MKYRFWVLPPLVFALVILAENRLYGDELPGDADSLPPPSGAVVTAPGSTQPPAALPELPLTAHPTPQPANTAVPKPTAVPPVHHALLSFFEEGLAYYKKGRYEEAISWFRDALDQPRRDPMGFYYVGVCQLRMGEVKEALVSLTLYYQLHTSNSLLYYLDGLREKLTNEENRWVEGQINTYGTGTRPELPPEENYPEWGIQFNTEISLINLPPFLADAQAQAYNAGLIDETTDPSYNFTGTIPSGYVGFEAEPCLRLIQGFEVDLPLAYLPVGTVTDKVQSNLYGNSQVSYALSALMAGLDGRIVIGSRPFQFFVSAGPRLANVQVNVTSMNSARTTTVNFTQMVFGAQAQAGVDWEFLSPLHLIPAVGYRLLDANHLTGNVTTGSGTAFSRLEYNTNSPGSFITSVPDAQPDPVGMSPLDVNLSGPIMSLSISALF